MYLYTSCDDSKGLFPQNDCWDFIVELPKSLENYSKVALTHVWFRSKAIKGSYYYLLCDVVESSVVGGIEAPVLATFYEPGAVGNPAYIKLTLDSIKRLRLTVKSADKKPLQDITKEIYFTLHFVK